MMFFYRDRIGSQDKDKGKYKSKLSSRNKNLDRD